MNQQLLRAHLANTDLDIIDQLLKGTINPQAKILDAGCGEGRNLTYFVKNNFPVWAIDSNPSAVKYCQYYAKGINQNFPVENIITESIEEVLFPHAFFDVIICINVLHDARDQLHLYTILKKLKDLLAPSGSLLLKVNAGTIEEKDLQQYFDVLSPRKNEITPLYSHSFWVLQPA